MKLESVTVNKTDNTDHEYQNFDYFPNLEEMIGMVKSQNPNWSSLVIVIVNDEVKEDAT